MLLSDVLCCIRANLVEYGTLTTMLHCRWYWGSTACHH